MRNYVIITDSSCNLSGAELKEYSIGCLPMHFYIGDKAYDSSGDWEQFGAKEYYDLMRNGQRITSSQVTSAQYEKAFADAVKEGFDVLSISCTGALSASVNESRMAREKVLKANPDAKIYCVDSLSSCYALGMLVLEAAKLQKAGKTLDEVFEWIENNKAKFNEAGTVEKLTYLKQAGRVSATAAFFGGLLGVKPIVISDEVGHNVAVEKVKGRRNSFEKIAEYIVKFAKPDVIPDLYIAHGDCIEDAKVLFDVIASKYPENTWKPHFGYIEQGVGSACGPGTLIVDFFADENMRVKM